MRKDPETWKCIGIGLFMWIIACISILAGRVEFSLGAENQQNPLQEEVIFSRVITQEGEYISTGG